MDYSISDYWHELLDSFSCEYLEHSSDSKSEADYDDDFYDDDDHGFIKALYPIIEYSCSDTEEVFVPPKRVHIDYEWVFEKMFSRECEAIAAVNSEELWVPHKKSYTSEGLRVLYRCNKVPRDGPQCAAKVYLLYHQASSSIMLYRTVAKHDHISILVGLDQSGIKKEKKAKRLRQKSILESFSPKKYRFST